MNHERIRAWTIVLAGAALAVAGCTASRSTTTLATGSPPQPAVKLEVTLHGGFAYVRDGDNVEAAFLKSVGDAPMAGAPQMPTGPTCHVSQLGVDLRID